MTVLWTENLKLDSQPPFSLMSPNSKTWRGKTLNFSPSLIASGVQVTQFWKGVLSQEESFCPSYFFAHAWPGGVTIIFAQGGYDSWVWGPSCSGIESRKRVPTCLIIWLNHPHPWITSLHYSFCGEKRLFCELKPLSDFLLCISQ